MQVYLSQNVQAYFFDKSVFDRSVDEHGARVIENKFLLAGAQ